MAFESADEFSGFGIPELDGFVVAGAGDVLTVGADGDIENPTLMAFEYLLLFSTGDIPDANAAIVATASTDEGPAIGAKGNGQNIVGMAQKGLEQFAGFHIP